MPFFFTTEAARRYEQFRPQIHSVALEWLRIPELPARYQRALDFGCGTGHSLAPLGAIADFAEGVDQSEAMLAHARRKGLNVRVGSWDSLPQRSYNLITLCMALHWSNREQAVSALRACSADSAIWLIYNFYFAGHASDDVFNAWRTGWFRTQFPSPPRAPADFDVGPRDNGLALIRRGSGLLRMTFDRPSLIGFVTTQSNIEQGLKACYGYEKAERDLDASMPAFEQGEFLYGYTYSIVRYERN
jgi:SAM-dependent methyltransferase